MGMHGRKVDGWGVPGDDPQAKVVLVRWDGAIEDEVVLWLVGAAQESRRPHRFEAMSGNLMRRLLRARTNLKS